METPAPPLAIAPLSTTDVPAAADLLARAFHDDRVARLLQPDQTRRRRYHDRAGKAMIQRAMAYRHVFAAYEGGAVRGIAVWLPPGVAMRPSLPALNAVPRIVKALAQPGTIRLLRDRQRAVAQAHEVPSWHLSLLATDPAHQGRGVGRRLLGHVLERADADGTPVWLETTDPANVGLYERFGFTTTAQIPGKAGLPTFWIMVRRASETRPSAARR